MNTKGKSTLEIFENNLRVKNYSFRTINMYVYYAKLYINNFTKNTYELTLKDLDEYLLNFKYSSIAQQNQIINSLKLFYKYCLNKKDIHLSKIERPTSERKLPQIIEKDFLLKQISKIENLKHKAIISLGFSVGLRVSEVINLKIEDIDSKRMIINIKNGKGKKDRIVPLSQNIFELLREYFKNYKPKEYLFNGQNSLKYSSTSCNQIVKKYLGEKYHFHLLRHSCFTIYLNNTK